MSVTRRHRFQQRVFSKRFLGHCVVLYTAVAFLLDKCGRELYSRRSFVNFGRCLHIKRRIALRGGTDRQVADVLLGKSSAASDFEIVAPEFTYYGVNTFSLNIGEKKILVDPLLVGDLTFFGQNWAYAGSKRDDARSVQPEPRAVYDTFDVVVLTQGLEDHAHLPTLRSIDKRMQIVASPNAAKVAEGLGFRSVKALEHEKSVNIGKYLRVTAVPGSVVGPPWDEPENGFVFSDMRPGGRSIGIEPHGNFLGPLLGTSLKLLPRAPKVSVDALIMPLTAQSIGGYPLVNGIPEAIKTLQALRPVPKFVLPLNNGNIDANGPLAAALKEEGTVDEFKQQISQHPRLSKIQVLDVTPGRAVRVA